MCPADPQDGGSGRGAQPPEYQGLRIAGLKGIELDPEQLVRAARTRADQLSRPARGSAPRAAGPAAGSGVPAAERALRVVVAGEGGSERLLCLLSVWIGG